MQIIVQLPDDLARYADAPRQALEAFVAEVYRTKSLTGPQCRNLLGFTRFEFYDWRNAKNLTHDFYGVDDLQKDIRHSDARRAAGLLSVGSQR